MYFCAEILMADELFLVKKGFIHQKLNLKLWVIIY